MKSESVTESQSIETAVPWERIARLALTSRAIDELEETRLAPEKRVLYQFSARGHELGQLLLAAQLDRPRDAASGYYRSRPLMLSLGVSVEDAIAAPMALSGSYSDGRDIGVVANLARLDGPVVLPMAGDVGSQYTPAAGWAQAIVYRRKTLNEEAFLDSISVALGGDGSVATNGFWSALTIATTLKLPLLFFIEDNGFGLSVPSSLQTPGGNIAANLDSFANLRVYEGDGSEPVEAASRVKAAVDWVRSGRGPALLRLKVPRLCGHSLQDNQAYKSPELLEKEIASDPLAKLRRWMIGGMVEKSVWNLWEKEAVETVEKALERLASRKAPDPDRVRRYLFSENLPDGSLDVQKAGGLAPDGCLPPPGSNEPKPQATRVNMVDAIRMTLESELQINPRLLVFGEDVGVKGGVHTATRGLQEKFGPDRVFDTSLSEEGIVGRGVGMALAGLMPAVEIQFRKYADPATEQLNNCGTIRWRCANAFAAPLVVRMPGGFSKCGDPWHSVCGEVFWARALGWKLAFPSNAEDAAGLLRTALRGNDPTIFFEHRALLDAASARRPYPGDDFALPFGRARIVQTGHELTVATWGAMVERCLGASKQAAVAAEIIDLRTLQPWDRECVIESLKKTKRCLIVHEDWLTGGFGAEISATLAKEAFFDLDAPIDRVAVPDVPVPYNTGLMDEVVPSESKIARKMREIVEF